jgi:predicted ATPase
VFVGRERELNALDRAWREVRDGATRFVVVGGPPGIGKSSHFGPTATAVS